MTCLNCECLEIMATNTVLTKNKFSLQKRLQNQISCFWHEWKWQIFSSQLSEAGRRENIAKIYDRDRCCHICHRLSLTFSFSLWWTPPLPLLLLLVEKPLLWRMSWPLPIEVVGRWLLEGLWSQISASPPVYPGASAPPRISNFFLSKYWQLPVVLYNIEVERLLPQQSLLTLSFGAKCQSFFLCDSTFLLASYCPFSSVQLQVHWGPKHFWRTKLRFVGRFFFTLISFSITAPLSPLWSSCHFEISAFTVRNFPKASLSVRWPAEPHR